MAGDTAKYYGLGQPVYIIIQIAAAGSSAAGCRRALQSQDDAIVGTPSFMAPSRCMAIAAIWTLAPMSTYWADYYTLF